MASGSRLKPELAFRLFAGWNKAFQGSPELYPFGLSLNLNGSMYDPIWGHMEAWIPLHILGLALPSQDPVQVEEWISISQR